MATTASDVEEILTALATVGVVGRVGGGWGIDALVGEKGRDALVGQKGRDGLVAGQTREHRDLDLAVPADDLDKCLSVLGGRGFVVTTDWLPVRVELSAGERHLDLHPLHVGADGSAWQAGLDDTRFHYPADAWTDGVIGTYAVVCLTAAMQRSFHSGYEPRDVDRHDLALLDQLDDLSR